MSVRRALVLTLLAAAGAVLVLVVPPPPRQTGDQAVSGPRLFKLAAPEVGRVVVTIGERRASVERRDGHWTAAGVAVDAAAAAAIDDLVATLVGLRAVDRFRPKDGATFGLDPPRATVELVSPRRRTRLLLGELNAARSAVYARREATPQVMLVGLYVVSALERVIYFRSADRSAAAPSAP